MIIGITGTSGAGKGTVAELIVKCGFEHLQGRDFLINDAKERGLSINRDTLIEVANDLRKTYYPWYIVKKMLEGKTNNCVIESIRNHKEAEFIQRHGGVIIAVIADIEVRYGRIIERQSETDKVTFEKFKEQDRHETTGQLESGQQLKTCIDMANFKITNNGDKEDLSKRVDSILRWLYCANYS